MKTPTSAVTRAVMFSMLLAMVATFARAQTCPNLVGRWPLGPATAMKVSGTTAYVAMGSALEIVDLTNLDTPSVLGEVSIPGVIQGFAVDGNLVYVAAEEAGLRIIDVSNPSAPVEVASEPNMRYAADVAVDGGYAFVTNGSELGVIDVAGPFPLLVQIHHLGYGRGRAVAVSGNVAVVAMELSSNDDDLVIVDISDPLMPVEVGTIDNQTNYPADLAITGSVLSLADETGLRMIDISDPGAPVEIGSYSPIFGQGKGLSVDGSYVFLGLDKYSSGAVEVIDISTPSAPFRLADFNTPGPAAGVWASGHDVVVAAEGAGLRIRDWWMGVDRGSIDGSGPTWDVDVDGSHAYLVDAATLKILDVSSISAPMVLGSVAAAGAAEIEVSGNFAFMAAGSEGLRVVDVSSPASPIEVAVHPTGNTAGRVAVAGGLAYVAVSDSLQIVDVTTPSSPVGLGSLAMTAVGVAVHGTHAYVADGGGLRVVDVSNPAAPTQVGYLATPGVAWDVAVNGDLAFVGARFGGLRVIDVGNPVSPIEIGFIDQTSGFYRSAVHLVLDGTIVYVSDESWGPFSGVTAIDVSDPTNPVEAGFSETPGIAYRSALGGGQLYVADGAAGLTVLSTCIVDLGEIFADNFETGDTSAWSSSSP